MQSFAKISEKLVTIISMTSVEHGLVRRQFLSCILNVIFANFSFGPLVVVLGAGCQPRSLIRSHFIVLYASVQVAIYFMALVEMAVCCLRRSVGRRVVMASVKGRHVSTCVGERDTLLGVP